MNRQGCRSLRLSTNQLLTEGHFGPALCQRWNTRRTHCPRWLVQALLGSAGGRSDRPTGHTAVPVSPNGSTQRDHAAEPSGVAGILWKLPVHQGGLPTIPDAEERNNTYNRSAQDTLPLSRTHELLSYIRHMARTTSNPQRIYFNSKLPQWFHITPITIQKHNGSEGSSPIPPPPTAHQNLVYNWCTTGLQLVYNWSTTGLQLVYNWSTTGLQLVYTSCPPVCLPLCIHFLCKQTPKSLSQQR